jgi:hypothetical protein
MSTLQVANLWFESTGSQRIFATSNALIRISSNGGVQIPTGTTAGRPTNEAGIIRYNTDTGLLEYGNSVSWVSFGAAVDLSPTNNWTNTSVTAANNWTNTSVTAANNWANTKLSNGAITIAGSVTTTGVFVDSKGGDVRDVPPNDRSTTAISYTLAITDTGKMVMGNANSATAVIYVPNAVFSTGNTIVIYNNSSGALLVSPNSSVTLRQVGSNTTGNMNVTSFGLATIICVQANTFVLTGSLA